MSSPDPFLFSDDSDILTGPDASYFELSDQDLEDLSYSQSVNDDPDYVNSSTQDSQSTGGSNQSQVSDLIVFFHAIDI